MRSQKNSENFDEKSLQVLAFQKTGGRLALSLYVFLHIASTGPRAPTPGKGHECPKNIVSIYGNDFEFSDSITPGHSSKLKKPRVLKSFRMNSCGIRAIDKWNNLTDDIVTMYDRYMGDQKYHTGDIY